MEPLQEQIAWGLGGRYDFDTGGYQRYVRGLILRAEGLHGDALQSNEIPLWEAVAQFVAALDEVQKPLRRGARFFAFSEDD